MKRRMSAFGYLIKALFILERNPLKHVAVGGIHVQACQGYFESTSNGRMQIFCKFSGLTRKRTPFTGDRDRNCIG